MEFNVLVLFPNVVLNYMSFFKKKTILNGVLVSALEAKFTCARSYQQDDGV